MNRERTKTDLINDGFTRYALNSKDDLPSWFLDDEAKHYMPNIPITKEAVAALRAQQRALDARPIKKVAEAKARKKFKAAQQLEKAMKKAEGVTQTADMTEREKAQQVEKLMRKGLSKGKKKKEVKVVVAKGVHRGLKGRPKGVKGRYTMVDARMRKEVRGFLPCDVKFADHSAAGASEKKKREGEQKAETNMNVLSRIEASAHCCHYIMSGNLDMLCCLYSTLVVGNGHAPKSLECPVFHARPPRHNGLAALR